MDKKIEKFNQALDRVQAESALKDHTLAYLQKERERREKNFFRADVRRMGFAAAVLLMVLGIGIWTGYSMSMRSVSYIGVGTASPVELALNRFGTVVHAETYDGSAEFDDSLVLGKSYQEALDELLEEAGISGKEKIQISVVSDQGDILAEGILHCTDAEHCHVECYSADDEVVTKAKDCGLPVWKYQIYEEICAFEPDFEIERCKAMSMNELRGYLKGCRTKDTETEEDCGSAESGQTETYHHRESIQRNVSDGGDCVDETPDVHTEVYEEACEEMEESPHEASHGSGHGSGHH